MEPFTLSKASQQRKRRRSEDMTPAAFLVGPTVGYTPQSVTPSGGIDARPYPNGQPANADDDVRVLRGKRIVSPADPKWDFDKDNQLRMIVAEFSTRDWRRIALMLGDPSLTPTDCKNRWNKILRANRTCGPWTSKEDSDLTRFVREIQHSGDKRHSKHIQWADVAAKMVWRDGKQCRERWCNQLCPEISHDSWSTEEKRVVFEAQRRLGNKWSQIAKKVPGRTESAVKNLFNTYKRKAEREMAPEKREQPIYFPPYAPPPHEVPVVQEPVGAPMNLGGLDFMNAVPESFNNMQFPYTHWGRIETVQPEKPQFHNLMPPIYSHGDDQSDSSEFSEPLVRPGNPGNWP